MRKRLLFFIIAGVLILAAIALTGLKTDHTHRVKIKVLEGELSTLPARAPNGQFTERK